MRKRVRERVRDESLSTILIKNGPLSSQLSDTSYETLIYFSLTYVDPLIIIIGELPSITVNHFYRRIFTIRR